MDKHLGVEAATTTSNAMWDFLEVEANTKLQRHKESLFLSDEIWEIKEFTTIWVANMAEYIQ